MNYYIAFPNNTLSYDCSKCNAYCCLHPTLSWNNSQFNKIAKVFPEVSIFSSSYRKITYFSVGDVCWFLKKNKCVFSRKQKPIVCLFHPLKIMRGPNDYILIFYAPCPTTDILREPTLVHSSIIKDVMKLLKIDPDFWITKMDQIHFDKTYDWHRRFKIESIYQQIPINGPLKLSHVLSEWKYLTIQYGSFLEKELNGIKHFLVALPNEHVFLTLLCQIRVMPFMLPLNLKESYRMVLFFIKTYSELIERYSRVENVFLTAWFIALRITECEIILQYSRPSISSDFRLLKIKNKFCISNSDDTYRREINYNLYEFLKHLNGATPLRDIFKQLELTHPYTRYKLIWTLRRERFIEFLMSENGN